MAQKHSKITQAEYQTLADLRYTLRRFLNFSAEAAKAAGLTPQQHQALLAIKGCRRSEPTTIAELSERLQIRHHSAVGLVNRLVAHDLVARTKSARDRREVHLTLTTKGETVLEQLSSVHKEQLRRAGPDIAALLRELR